MSQSQARSVRYQREIVRDQRGRQQQEDWVLMVDRAWLSFLLRLRGGLFACCSPEKQQCMNQIPVLESFLRESLNGPFLWFSRIIITVFFHFQVSISPLLLLVELEEAGQGVVGQEAHRGQEVRVVGDKDGRIGHHLVLGDKKQGKQR